MEVLFVIIIVVAAAVTCCVFLLCKYECMGVRGDGRERGDFLGVSALEEQNIAREKLRRLNGSEDLKIEMENLEKRLDNVKERFTKRQEKEKKIKKDIKRKRRKAARAAKNARERKREEESKTLLSTIQRVEDSKTTQDAPRSARGMVASPNTQRRSLKSKLPPLKIRKQISRAATPQSQAKAMPRKSRTMRMRERRDVSDDEDDQPADKKSVLEERRRERMRRREAKQRKQSGTPVVVAKSYAPPPKTRQPLSASRLPVAALQRRAIVQKEEPPAPQPAFTRVSRPAPAAAPVAAASPVASRPIVPISSDSSSTSSESEPAKVKNIRELRQSTFLSSLGQSFRSPKSPDEQRDSFAAPRHTRGDSLLGRFQRSTSRIDVDPTAAGAQDAMVSQPSMSSASRLRSPTLDRSAVSQENVFVKRNSIASIHETTDPSKLAGVTFVRETPTKRAKV